MYPVRSFLFCLLLLALVPAGHAQVFRLTTPDLTQSTVSPLPPSNSISHLVSTGGILWAGTSDGLARTPNGGRNWESFAGVPQFASPGIFAVDVRGGTIWASTGYTKEVNDQSVQTGSGYSYSLDNGSTWAAVPQTMDARGDSIVTYGNNTVWFLPIVVPEQNVTFDLALGNAAVWIASWSSGLRKSTDNGQTWQRTVLPSSSRNSVAPTDSLGAYRVDPRRDNNYLAFSVMVQDSATIWAGTAGGVNKSTDGGVSWTRFSTSNQMSPILSDWVITISAQRFGTGTRVWTTNWPAQGPNQQYGVSYTDDGGRSWKNFLIGVKAYAFTFRDSVTYVATDDGMYRTADGGLSWTRSGTIIDQTSGARIATSAFFAVAVIGDTVYGGTGDGLAKTPDNSQTPFGGNWQVIRTYVPSNNRATSYAYPNPFSPQMEKVRIHYSTGNAPAEVTIELFDFGMNRIRTLIKGVSRSGEQDEIWDGRTGTGMPVPNGVYFYRVTMDNDEPSWGKVMVLQ
ncbi:MAG: hypothetical protein H6Q30_2422 [Bacteroidetes bacterium]|nr:hypothetical protein [Bacteroidota bacterium]